LLRRKDLREETLQGEKGSVERFFEERRAPWRQKLQRAVF
jgi:hypothetical protein